MFDDALDMVDGPAIDQGRPDHLHLMHVQLRIAEHVIHDVSKVKGELRPCESDKHSALAFPQVIPGRLSRDGGISEDAQHVVAQLVGDPERKSEGSKRGDLSRRSAPECCANRERCLDAVLGRLVDDHPVSPGKRLSFGIGSPRVFLEDVEILPGSNLGAHGRKFGAASGSGRSIDEHRCAAIEQFIAPAEEQVAEQQCGGATEGGGIPLEATVSMDRLESPMS